MLFSIIIAVRNEKRLIIKCIESVFNQDFKDDYEVIIVDGMSNDGTYEILEELKNKYDFKFLKNEKINAAAGRNLGIKNSKGEFIAFIDGDAIPEKNWLKNIKSTFEKHDEVVGVGGPDLLPKDSSYKSQSIGRVMTSPLARGGRLNPSTQHSLMEEEKYVGHIPTCNLSLRREVFDKVGFFDETFVKGQDLELNYRITNNGFKLLYSPKIKVLHYRKNDFKSFSKQIYKWAKAKVAIIKKHGFNGLTSHVYLWPLYFIAGFVLGLLLFYFLNILNLFTFIFFIGLILYISVIIFESLSLSRRYHDRKFFPYCLFLLPLVHISYSLGVIIALIKRRIW
jgi:GT2 family glycosyltransferase